MLMRHPVLIYTYIDTYCMSHICIIRSISSLSYLELDILRSLNVKSNGVAGLPIYDLLLVFNSNHMRICRHLTYRPWATKAKVDVYTAAIL